MAQESRYSKIFVKIWHSKDFRTLSEEGKMLFLYLLTSPHRNMGGYYYLPLPYICFDTGLTEERVAKAFEELKNNDMAIYDYSAQVVLIKKWFCYNQIENENQAKGLNKQLAEIPKSQLFEYFADCVREYCKYFETILKGFDKPFQNPSERVSEPYTKPGTGTVTETVTETGYLYICAPSGARMNTKTETTKTKDITGESNPEEKSGPRSPFTNKRQEQLFDQFWAAYPRKKSKGQAEKAWAKLKPDEQLFCAIMAGLERAKTSAEWQKEGGQFIPYPATWLNAKGWEDEFKVKSNGRYDYEMLEKLGQERLYKKNTERWLFTRKVRSENPCKQ